MFEPKPDPSTKQQEKSSCESPEPQPEEQRETDIFCAGTWTDNKGETRTFTQNDIKDIAENYDPEKHQAPLVIGHPKHDAPAYGWVKTLRAVGDVLKAKMEQVDKRLKQIVGNGRYKKISAAFYLPDSPNNPTPGVFALRHVGLLGAMPPAVKGLKSASFGHANEHAEVFEMSGREAPKHQNEQKRNDQRTNQQILQKQQQNTIWQNQEACLFANRLVASGRIPAVLEDTTSRILSALQQRQNEVAFAEKTSVPIAQAVRNLLGKLPPSIVFGEITKDDKKTIQQNNPSQLATKARAYRMQRNLQGIEISAAQAVRAVHPSIKE